MAKSKTRERRDSYDDEKQNNYSKQFKISKEKKNTDKYFKNAVRSRSWNKIIEYTEDY